MKILVAVKRVIDYEVDIQIKPDGSGIVCDNVPMALNPFDEVALEEAIRLKSAGIVDSILAVSVGDEACRETLRTTLAMGADEALLVKSDSDVEPLAVAKILAKLAAEKSVDLILFGKQAIDNDANQTGQMTAALLNCGQAVFVSQLSVDKTNKLLTAVRDSDFGTETLQLPLPAVVTAALRLNEPRFIALPQLLRAKKQPIATRDLATFGIDVEKRLHVVSLSKPPMRAPVKLLDSVEALADVISNND